MLALITLTITQHNRQ